ncbi:MAG: Rrf2 family transcriptional regulator [Sphingomonadales bacterium]|nr:Rrf2 family transcriptional regulator [Sphingomonadales bacterium]MDE2171245.1 Rrf2 family transcriptional regulator [Sphingomonadales bacterium]
MRLTRFSDYAVRVTLYLATHAERMCSIGEIATAYGISRNHLMKVVSDLSHAGYIRSTQGRGGGIRLAHPPADINIGAMIRHTEGNVDLVDCRECRLKGACHLPGPLDEALDAFFTVLEKYTLSDVVGTGGMERLGRMMPS